MKTRKTIILALSALLVVSTAMAQMNVGSNAAPNANAALQVTSNSNKGLLLPTLALMATNSASPLTAFVAGMTVYNTAVAGTSPANVTPGFYYSDGTQWLKLSTSNGSVVLNSSTTVDAAILGYSPSTSATAATAATTPLMIGSVTATRRGTYTYTANGHSYTAYTTSAAVTWYEANNAAKAMGGYLATFTSDGEWLNVETNLLTDANGFYTNGGWIGFCKFDWQAGSALSPNPEMKWITGEQPATDYSSAGTTAVRKSNWFNLNEPNNAGSAEGFVQFFARNQNQSKGVNGTVSYHPWNDVTATNNSQAISWGFIVEFQQ